MNRLIAIAIIATAQATAAAQTANGRPPELSPNAACTPVTLWAMWENDGGPPRFFPRSDRYYTNGLAFIVTAQPDWAKPLADAMPSNEAFDADGRAGVGFVAGQLMFTPDDLRTGALIRDERPYAGYLYGGLYWQRATGRSAADAATLDHFEVNLGVIGPSSLAEDLQEAIHDLVDDQDPRGWGNQLHDEPAFQFYIRKKWRTAPASFELFDTPWQHQIIPQVGLAAGSVHRHLHGEVTARLGWRLPDDFGPPRIDDPPAAVAAPDDGWSVYGYARIGMKLVEHHTLIEGNNWRSSHGRDAEVWVGDAQLGVMVQYAGPRWAVRVGWAHTWRTHEFRSQQRDNHIGLIALAVAGWF